MRIDPMNLDNYPPEVTYEILSRAPVESAFQCKRVSRTWRNFFDYIKEGMIFAIGLNNEENPSFRLYYAENDMIKENINECRTYADFLEEIQHPPMENRYHSNPHENYKDVIVGSCNGLVCFTIPNGVLDDPVYICNPFIRESVNLPRLEATISPEGLVVSGFGFDLHNKQYKVVRIYYPDKNLDIGQVEVYTLGAGSGWRNIGEVRYSLCSSPGILVDGVLYWIDNKAMYIIGFNLKDEKFELLPSPPCLLHPHKTISYTLKKLKGRLCVVHHRRTRCLCDVHRRLQSQCLVHGTRLFKRVDIWFYTKDYNTWSLEIEFTPVIYHSDDDYDPLLVTEENKVLYWCDKSTLFCFDPITSTTTMVLEDSCDFGLKYFSATPHVNTRVSLKTLEKENCVAPEWDGYKGELYQPPSETQLIQGGVLPVPNYTPFYRIKIVKWVIIPLFIAWELIIWCTCVESMGELFLRFIKLALPIATYFSLTYYEV